MSIDILHYLNHYALRVENEYNIDGTVAVMNNKLMHPTGEHSDSHTYAYDAAGRLVKETVSYDGGEAVDVQKLSYNAIGTLSGNDLGVFNEEYTYNVRGAMTKRKSVVFEQNISFAGKYNGSIASISDQIADGLSMSGWYKYDKAGRLTQANMKVGGTPRFVDYTYDLNSNITTLVRDGDDGIDPIAWIDNMTYEYDGNKVRKITDANGDVISERTMDFPDLADLDVEYTYDRNGNMTGDANKGLEMSWDYNNRLYEVEDDEMTMTFNRTGSGQKLGKSVYVGPKPKNPLRPGLFRSPIWGSGGTFIPVDTVVEAGTTVSTDYFGAYEYVNGKFARLNTATGYRDGEGMHVYVRDWQGNIRAVVRKGDDGNTVLEQATYYYPYGMPMAESTNPTANSYKYTGKELLTDKGVNIYDYIARAYDPATCRWWSTDPKQEYYKSYSSYCFNQGDPINYFDPNGKFSKEWMASLSQTIYNSTHSNQAGPILVNETVENGCLMFTYQTTDIENGEFAVTLHTKFDKSIATGIQDVGDGMALAGYALTLSGVGAEVGVPLAYIGSAFSLGGSALECGIDILNIDWSNYNSGKAEAMKSIISLGTQILINKYLGKLLPGAKSSVKKVGYDYGDAVLNQGANLKVSGANRLASAAVDHKQKETTTGTPEQTSETEEEKDKK